MNGGAGRPRGDAVTWLTVFLVLLWAVPSRLVVGTLGSAGAPSMLFGLLSLLWWAWYQLNRPGPLEPTVEPVRRALVVFLGCLGVSYVGAMLRPLDPVEISQADVALLAVASWTGTLLVAHDGVTSRDRLDVLVRRLALGGGLVALLGLAQFVTGRTWVDMITLPGLTTAEQVLTFERQGFFRASGTATHPIEYGVLMTVLLPFALHSAFHRLYRSPLLRWGPAAAVALTIALSLSRSALLGAALGLAVLLPTWPRSRRLLTAGAVAGLVAVLFVAVPGFVGTVRGMFVGIENDPSIASRTGSYALAGEFIARAPFFGRGQGTFLPRYWIFDNQYLQLLVTVGVVGTLAFLGLVLSAVVSAARARRSATDPATRDLAQSVLAALVAGAAGMAMFDAFAFPMTTGTFFLVVGLAGALWRTTRSAPSRAGGSAPTSRHRLSSRSPGPG